MSTMHIINGILTFVLLTLDSTIQIKSVPQLLVKDGTSYTTISYLFQ